MAISSKNPFFFFYLFFSLNFPATMTVRSDSITGINYAQLSNDLPRLESVVTTLQSLKITRVRLPESDPELIRAFTFTQIYLLLSIPNTFIPQIAENRSFSLRWISDHVSPFFPRARIAIISVGNEVLSVLPELAEFLLPAMRNVYLSLQELGLRRISVSTSHSFDVITTAFPPSAAEFQESVADFYLKPILDFLAATNSSFLINLYPFYIYKSDPEITVGYALFEDQQAFNYRDDPGTGLRYRSLFDEMVDAVFTAMAMLGHENIPVIVTETGWPSSGDSDEPEANLRFAEMYNRGLIRHLKRGLGTPLRREGVAEVYIYSLFDGNRKQGTGSAQHWGILFTNLTKKYELDFSGSVFYQTKLKWGRTMIFGIGFWVIWFCFLF